VGLSEIATLPDKLLPTDESNPGSVRRYRLRVTLVACASFLTLTFLVLPAMTIGLPRIGSVAWGSEVDDKIEQAIAPVNAQLVEIKAQLDRGQEVQKRILQGQLASQLRDLHRLECTTTDEMTRSRMERDIEDAQQEYRTLAGERYPLPACKDL
jgi:hypothetical protein